MLGNLANMLQPQLDFTINHWNVMETSCGAIGGFIFCFGMVNRAYPDPPEKESITLNSVFGMIYVLGLIPLWHLLSRIDSAKKLEEWTASLRGWNYADPDSLAQTVLWLLDGVCVLGFVGVALWMVIYFARWQRLAALPVLWLSFTMILFQNLNALYFFYPSRERFVNMHNVFWAMFALMLAYALFARPKPVAEPQDANAPEPFFHWLGWLAGAAAGVGPDHLCRRLRQRRDDHEVGQYPLAALVLDRRPVSRGG